MGITSILLILFTALCTVCTQMLLKNVGHSIAQIVPEISIYNIGKLILFAVTQPQIILAVIIQGAGFVIWIVVLSREHAGAALGLGGACVYLLTAFAEWMIYDVRLGIVKIIALVFVSIGASLLTSINV